jgi:hypothetical protein
LYRQKKQKAVRQQKKIENKNYCSASGVEWSGVEWSGVEWSGVEWSGVEWSGVEFIINK